MKTNYKYIPSRELKVFLKQVEDQYGKYPKEFEDKAFIRGKEKIYMITREVDKINLDKIKINNIGLYIAEIKGQLRLSIEGSQIIGPTATKNVCEISQEQLKSWFRGEDINVEGNYDGFVILKKGKDFIGSGKYREGVILNFVPKARRLIEMH